MEFEWDELKARSNLRKHRVSFATARFVFDDPRSTETFDPMSSDYGEDRFKLVGYGGGELLAVIYTLRNGRVRLISARVANKAEHDNYQSQNPRQ
ncbi:MAG TPA: BrnT family toxin [Rhizomicrobium sp.]|jgi:hypothetical protein